MIGSCLMMSLKGPSLLKEERDFIISNSIAGVILFKRNIQSFKQTYELCSELKSLTKPSLLIAVDMEGGEVDRFSHLKESISWSSAEVLKDLEPDQIFSIAGAMAKQLNLLGIDINFAPVVDLLLVDSPLLKTRVFGKSKQSILKGAEAFIKGMIKEQLIPCLKHFPGHGGVTEDSHKSLPEDFRQLKDLESQLEIFQTLFEKYPCWIMTAHIEFPNIDKKPATFSETLLKTVLRKQRGFKNVLVSDDIDMSALKNYSADQSFFQAIKGGCDLVISCQKEDSPKEIINYFKSNPDKTEEIKLELEQSSKKILQVRNQSKTLSDFKSVEKELLKLKADGLPH